MVLTDSLLLLGFAERRLSYNRSRRTYHGTFRSAFTSYITSFNQKLILGFPSSFSSTHQRNLRSDPLQLLSGHQVVVLCRSHKSGSRQQAAGNRQQANNTYTASHLQHTSAPAHKTPPRLHRHSKRHPVPSPTYSSTSTPTDQSHQ